MSETLATKPPTESEYEIFKRGISLGEFDMVTEFSDKHPQTLNVKHNILGCHWVVRMEDCRYDGDRTNWVGDTEYYFFQDETDKTWKRQKGWYVFDYYEYQYRGTGYSTHREEWMFKREDKPMNKKENTRANIPWSPLQYAVACRSTAVEGLIKDKIIEAENDPNARKNLKEVIDVEAQEIHNVVDGMFAKRDRDTKEKIMLLTNKQNKNF